MISSMICGAILLKSNYLVVDFVLDFLVSFELSSSDFFEFGFSKRS
jgi:hypothetical protein